MRALQEQVAALEGAQQQLKKAMQLEADHCSKLNEERDAEREALQSSMEQQQQLHQQAVEHLHQSSLEVQKWRGESEQQQKQVQQQQDELNQAKTRLHGRPSGALGSAATPRPPAHTHIFSQKTLVRHWLGRVNLAAFLQWCRK